MTDDEAEVCEDDRKEVLVGERVELHGGPRHGQHVELPFTTSTSFEVEALFRVDGKHLRRRGKYTRVHDNSGRPEPNFEWIGYTTAYLPVETDS